MVCSYFIGWVPTVSGRLSYTVIGKTDHPTRSSYANVAGGNAQLVAVSQRRNLSDANSLVEHLSPYRNCEFQFMFLGEVVADPDEPQRYPLEILSGDVFIFERPKILKRWWYKILRKTPCFIEESLAYTEKLINRLSEYEPLPDGSISDEARNLHFKLRHICERNKDYRIKSQMKRNGITCFHFDPELDVAEKARKLPSSSEEEKQHYAHLVALQAYYFIRDIAHTHQHHARKTDTILDITEYQKINALDWARKIAFSLYMKIIQYKKVRRREMLAKSYGVLAYAKAFKKVIYYHYGSDVYHREMPPFFDDALEQSIDAAKIEEQFSVDKRYTLVQSIISGIPTTIALILTAALLGNALKGDSPQKSQGIGPPADILVNASSWVLSNPITVLFAAFTANIIIQLLSYKISEDSFNIVIQYVRIVQSFKKVIGIPIMFLVSILFFAVSWVSLF